MQKGGAAHCWGGAAFLESRDISFEGGNASFRVIGDMLGVDFVNLIGGGKD